MDNNSLFTDTEKRLLIDKLEAELDQLEMDLVEIEKQKRDSQALIKKLKNSLTDNGGVQTKRQSLLKGKDFTWKSKCLEILSLKSNFLTTDELYNLFIELNQDFVGIDKRTVQASLSGALSQLADIEEVVKIEKKFGKGNYWGLPAWFTNDGKAIEAYQIQLNQRGLGDFRFIPIFNQNINKFENA
jgi:hypothetical protein